MKKLIKSKIRKRKKKKEGRSVCKQKITERCVNISKIKKNYLFRPLPLPRNRTKRVPKIDERRENLERLRKIKKIGIFR